MPRYRFVGHDKTTFPGVVLAKSDGNFGVLELEPGEEVDLAEEVEHPYLEAVARARAPKE